MRDVTRQQGVTADNVFVEPMAKVEGMLTPATDMNAVRLKVPVMLGTGLACRLAQSRHFWWSACARWRRKKAAPPRRPSVVRQATSVADAPPDESMGSQARSSGRAWAPW